MSKKAAKKAAKKGRNALPADQVAHYRLEVRLTDARRVAYVAAAQADKKAQGNVSLWIRNLADKAAKFTPEV